MIKQFILVLIALSVLVVNATQSQILDSTASGFKVEDSVPTNECSIASSIEMTSDKEVSNARLLDVVLTPVGRCGVFLVGKLSVVLNGSKSWIAGKIGLDEESTLYSCVFISIWTVALLILWFGVKRFNATAYSRMKYWKRIRFLSISSGFCCIIFNLVGMNPHPDDYWQAASIPVGGLLVSLVAGLLYARNNISAGRVMWLVALDFVLGLILASLVKVILVVMILSVAFVIFASLLAMGGSGSSAGKSKGASERRIPEIKPLRDDSSTSVSNAGQGNAEPLMSYAEWKGKTVRVYDQYKRIVRTIHARRDVRSVQCTGGGNDGMIAITMDNGKTDLYRGNGQIVRRG